MKRPAFQFYPADWRKDAALQSCSVAAQGVWINALCIAHECEPYGHLTVNGRGMTAAQIGRLVGLSGKEAERLLDELFDAGVVSLADETDAYYSRRMVRDEDLRNRRAKGGPEGAEHGAKGAEHGRKGGRPRKDQGGIENPPSNAEAPEQKEDKKPPLKPPPSPSSSSSASTTTSLRSVVGAKRASRKCPPDFEVTAELREWARIEVPGIDVDRETRAMLDHEFKSSHSDWTGTWRNWMRRSEPVRKGINGNQSGGYAAQRNRAFAGEFADDAHRTIDEEKKHDIALPFPGR